MVRLLSLMLVEMGPTCFDVRFFVGWFFVVPPLLPSILHTSVVLQTIEDPNHDVSLARRELRNLWEVMDVVLSL